jgi:O-antigen/teichoic acid export membrane protein
MRDETRIIAFGSVLTLAGKAFNTGTQYLLLLILTRFLGPAEVGVFVLARTAMRLGAMVSTLGLDMGLVKFVQEFFVNRQYDRIVTYYSFSMMLSLICSTVCSVVIFLAAPFLSEVVFHDEALTSAFRWFACCIPLLSLLNVVKAMFRGMRRMGYFSLFENISVSVVTITMGLVFLLLVARRVEAIIWGVLVGLGGSVLVGSGLLKVIFSKLGAKGGGVLERRRIVSQSLPFMGTGLLGFFLIWADTFLLGVFRGSEEVGIYNVAARLAFFSEAVLYGVNGVFAPTIAKYYVENKLDELKCQYRRTVRWVIYICTPVYIVLFVFADNVLSLFGKEFGSGVQVLIIMSIGQLFNISVGSAGYILSMTGKQGVEMMNRVGCLAANVILNITLIPKYGLLGCAVATSSSLVLVNVLRVIENYRFLGVHPYGWHLFMPSTAFWR